MATSALLLILALLASPALAQRAKADIVCKYAGTGFAYDCIIQVTRDAKPVTGLTVVVGADMPSMPMAHSVKPATARPGKTAGEYLARLELEMPGEWAVKLRLSGPVRDVLVLHYTFTQ